MSAHSGMRPRSFKTALWFFPLVLIAGEIRNAMSGTEVVGIVRVTLPVLILALAFTVAALWPAAEAVLRGTGSLVPSVISLVVASLPWIAIKQECVRQLREFEKALTS